MQKELLHMDEEKDDLFDGICKGVRKTKYTLKTAKNILGSSRHSASVGAMFSFADINFLDDCLNLPVELEMDVLTFSTVPGLIDSIERYNRINNSEVEPAVYAKLSNQVKINNKLLKALKVYYAEFKTFKKLYLYNVSQKKIGINHKKYKKYFISSLKKMLSASIVMEHACDGYEKYKSIDLKDYLNKMYGFDISDKVEEKKLELWETFIAKFIHLIRNTQDEIKRELKLLNENDAKIKVFKSGNHNTEENVVYLQTWATDDYFNNNDEALSISEKVIEKLSSAVHFGIDKTISGIKHEIILPKVLSCPKLIVNENSFLSFKQSEEMTKFFEGYNYVCMSSSSNVMKTRYYKNKSIIRSLNNYNKQKEVIKKITGDSYKILIKFLKVREAMSVQLMNLEKICDISKDVREYLSKNESKGKTSESVCSWVEYIGQVKKLAEKSIQNLNSVIKIESKVDLNNSLSNDDFKNIKIDYERLGIKEIKFKMYRKPELKKIDGKNGDKFNKDEFVKKIYKFKDTKNKLESLSEEDNKKIISKAKNFSNDCKKMTKKCNSYSKEINDIIGNNNEKISNITGDDSKKVDDKIEEKCLRNSDLVTKWGNAVSLYSQKLNAIFKRRDVNEEKISFEIASNKIEDMYENHKYIDTIVAYNSFESIVNSYVKYAKKTLSELKSLNKELDKFAKNKVHKKVK